MTSSRRDFIKALGVGTAGLATAMPRRAWAAPNPPETLYPRNPWGPERLTPGVDRTALIVVGGLAGLSAALELAERGYRVTLKEAGSVLGGRLGTREVENEVGSFRVEHGLHMWFHN